MNSMPLAAARSWNALLAMLLVLALAQEAKSQVPPPTPKGKVTSQPAKKDRPDPPPTVAQAQYLSPPDRASRTERTAPQPMRYPAASPTHRPAAPRPNPRQGVTTSAYYDSPGGSGSRTRPAGSGTRSYAAAPGQVFYEGEPEFVEPPRSIPQGYQDQGEIVFENGFATPGAFPDEFIGPDGAYCPDCVEGPYGPYGPYGAPMFPVAFYTLSFAKWVLLSNDWLLENFSISNGFHAFQGPTDFGRNGNFGLHTGFNWGGPIWPAASVGFQLGYQALFSDFEGNTLFGPTGDSRTQHVITAGIFHRPIYSPWQWGVVADWMRDEFFVDMSLTQVRAELSFLGPKNNELGFTSSISTGDDESLFVVEQNGQIVINRTEVWESIDLYAFFWRRRFHMGSEVRVWGGFTGDGDGLFGGDYRVPLSPWLALTGSANYLAPSSGDDDLERESWGLMLNLVWYPGKTAEHSTRSLWRPLFNVADPTNFIADRHVVP